MSYRFGDLVQRAILRMSQVYGTSTQVYSEDIITEMMQHKFDMLFEERWWPSYSRWRSSPLNDQGYVTANLSLEVTNPGDPEPIRQYRDIRAVYYYNDPDPLPQFRQDHNPNNLIRISGSSRPTMFMWDESITGKYFRVLPFGSTQEVHIAYRARPMTLDPDDDVRMDDHLLILGTCYDYAEDDGTNPGATAKFESLFNARYAQVLGSDNETPVPLHSGGRYVSHQYTPWGGNV